jgi:hypothetical protein
MANYSIWCPALVLPLGVEKSWAASCVHCVEVVVSWAASCVHCVEVVVGWAASCVHCVEVVVSCAASCVHCVEVVVSCAASCVKWTSNVIILFLRTCLCFLCSSLSHCKWSAVCENPYICQMCSTLLKGFWWKYYINILQKRVKLRYSSELNTNVFYTMVAAGRGGSTIKIKIFMLFMLKT